MPEAQGRKRAYLDSNVFIYLMEGEEKLADLVTRLMYPPSVRRGAFVTSELTLAEVLSPSRVSASLAAKRRDHYIDLLTRTDSIELLAITRSILIEAAELRGTMRLKLPDAIHCATALQARCEFFVSRDKDMRTLSESVRWLDINETNVTVILEALRG